MKPKKDPTVSEMDESTVDPLQVVQQLVLLIVEARTPDQSVKGRVEGPHCALIGGGPPSHNCSVEREECARADQFCKSASRLWSNGIPVCVDVLLFPACIHGRQEVQVVEGTVTTATRENALLVERWTLEMERGRPQLQLLHPSLLLQAVRSHLHFSQISSWLDSKGGCLPGLLFVYRICAPCEESTFDFPHLSDSHNFPVCTTSRQQLRVRVNALNRQSSVPSIMCIDHDYSSAAAVAVSSTSTDLDSDCNDDNCDKDYHDDDGSGNSGDGGSDFYKYKYLSKKSQHNDGRGRKFYREWSSDDRSSSSQKKLTSTFEKTRGKVDDGYDVEESVFFTEADDVADEENLWKEFSMRRNLEDGEVKFWKWKMKQKQERVGLMTGKRKEVCDDRDVFGVRDSGAGGRGRGSLMEREKGFVCVGGVVEKNNVECFGREGVSENRVITRDCGDLDWLKKGRRGGIRGKVRQQIEYDGFGSNLIRGGRCREGEKGDGFYREGSCLDFSDEEFGGVGGNDEVFCGFVQNSIWMSGEKRWESPLRHDPQRHGRGQRLGGNSKHVSRWEEFKKRRKEEKAAILWEEMLNTRKVREEEVMSGGGEIGGGDGWKRGSWSRRRGRRKRKEEWKKDGEKDLRIEQMKLGMTLIRKCDDDEVASDENFYEEENWDGNLQMGNETSETKINDGDRFTRRFEKKMDFKIDDKLTTIGFLHEMKDRQQKLLESYTKSPVKSSDPLDHCKCRNDLTVSSVQSDENTKNAKYVEKSENVKLKFAHEKDIEKWCPSNEPSSRGRVEGDNAESFRVGEKMRFKTTRLTNEEEFIKNLSNRISIAGRKCEKNYRSLETGKSSVDCSENCQKDSLPIPVVKSDPKRSSPLPLSIDVSFSEFDFEVDSDATPIASPNSNSNTLTRSSGTESLFKLMAEKKLMAQELSKEKCDAGKNSVDVNLVEDMLELNKSDTVNECTEVSCDSDSLCNNVYCHTCVENVEESCITEKIMDKDQGFVSDHCERRDGGEGVENSVEPKGEAVEYRGLDVGKMSCLSFKGESETTPSNDLMTDFTSNTERSRDPFQPNAVSKSELFKGAPVETATMTTVMATTTTTTISRRMFQENLLPLASYDAETDSFKNVDETTKGGNHILHSPKVLFSCDVPEDCISPNNTAKMESRKYIDFEKVLSESQFFKAKLQDVLGEQGAFEELPHSDTNSVSRGIAEVCDGGSYVPSKDGVKGTSMDVKEVQGEELKEDEPSEGVGKINFRVEISEQMEKTLMVIRKTERGKNKFVACVSVQDALRGGESDENKQERDGNGFLEGESTVKDGVLFNNTLRSGEETAHRVNRQLDFGFKSQSGGEDCENHAKCTGPNNIWNTERNAYHSSLASDSEKIIIPFSFQPSLNLPPPSSLPSSTSDSDKIQSLLPSSSFPNPSTPLPQYSELQPLSSSSSFSSSTQKSYSSNPIDNQPYSHNNSETTATHKLSRCSYNENTIIPIAKSSLLCKSVLTPSTKKKQVDIPRNQTLIESVGEISQGRYNLQLGSPTSSQQDVFTSQTEDLQTICALNLETESPKNVDEVQSSVTLTNSISVDCENEKLNGCEHVKMATSKTSMVLTSSSLDNIPKNVWELGEVMVRKNSGKSNGDGVGLRGNHVIDDGDILAHDKIVMNDLGAIDYKNQTEMDKICKMEVNANMKQETVVENGVGINCLKGVPVSSSDEVPSCSLTTATISLSNPFYQLINSRDRGGEGVGIGLSMRETRCLGLTNEYCNGGERCDVKRMGVETCCSNDEEGDTQGHRLGKNKADYYCDDALTTARASCVDDCKAKKPQKSEDDVEMYGVEKACLDSSKCLVMDRTSHRSLTTDFDRNENSKACCDVIFCHHENNANCNVINNDKNSYTTCKVSVNASNDAKMDGTNDRLSNKNKKEKQDFVNTIGNDQVVKEIENLFSKGDDKSIYHSNISYRRTENGIGSHAQVSGKPSLLSERLVSSCSSSIYGSARNDGGKISNVEGFSTPLQVDSSQDNHCAHLSSFYSQKENHFHCHTIESRTSNRCFVNVNNDKNGDGRECKGCAHEDNSFDRNDEMNGKAGFDFWETQNGKYRGNEKGINNKTTEEDTGENEKKDDDSDKNTKDDEEVFFYLEESIIEDSYRGDNSYELGNNWRQYKLYNRIENEEEKEISQEGDNGREFCDAETHKRDHSISVSSSLSTSSLSSLSSFTSSQDESSLTRPPYTMQSSLFLPLELSPATLLSAPSNANTITAAAAASSSSSSSSVAAVTTACPVTTNTSAKLLSSSLSTTDDLNVQTTSSPHSDLDPSTKVTSKRSRLSSFGDISEGWDPTPPSRSVSSPNCMEGEVRGRGHQRSNCPRNSLLQQSMHNLAKEGREHRSSTISGTSMVFNSRTSLPTQSSPAPLKRNPGGRFDYDSTLVSVRAIKNAFSCSKLVLGGDSNDSRDDDDDHKRTLSTSAPASTNCLLGNFEESILNGRIDPVGTVSGFSAEIGASGSFCPKHIHRPVSAFFFDLSDDNAPSPYLGHINLRSVGSKKGYHIPKKGTVQVTLFNPNKTVVKMFVVMYDLSDMPASSQTFIRQRTMYVPCDRNSTAPTYLRYLIHLRCSSSRSGKIYLHTDIRLIFARHKLDMDAKTVPYEMKSFTELPKNPKYSPKK